MLRTAASSPARSLQLRVLRSRRATWTRASPSTTRTATLHSARRRPGAHARARSSSEQTDKAIAFVDKHAGPAFFLWVHYYDPHSAYEPHPEMPDRFGDRRGRSLRRRDPLHRPPHRPPVRRAPRAGPLRQDDHRRHRRPRRGLRRARHRDKRHGYHLYAAQTKVPLIIRVPGLPPRARRTTPAGHVDIIADDRSSLGAGRDDEPTLHGALAPRPHRRHRARRRPRRDLPGGHLRGAGLDVQRHAEARRRHPRLAPHRQRRPRRHRASSTTRSAIPPRITTSPSTASRPSASCRARWRRGWTRSRCRPASRARSAGNVTPDAVRADAPLGDSLGGLAASSTASTRRRAAARAASRSTSTIYLARRAGDAPRAGSCSCTSSAAGRMINADHEPVEGSLPLARLRAGPVRARSHRT